MARWNYSGDINLEYGGLFWRKDGNATDYVLAIEVTPCSNGGGPDNKFVVVDGSIYLPENKYQAALDCCGYKLDENGNIVDCLGDVHKKGSKGYWFLLVDAFRAYHGVEDDCTCIVQIGKAEACGGRGYNPEVTDQLRANAKLKNWVRREFMAG